MRVLSLFKAAFAVSILFLAGCFPGVNVDGLQLPADALTDYSNKKTETFSVFSHALSKTDLQSIERKSSLSMDTEELIKLLDEIEKHKAALRIRDRDITDLRALFTTIQGLENTNTKPSHWAITRRLYEQLNNNNSPYSRIAAALNTQRTTFPYLAERFPELFKMRVRNELWHIGVPLMRDFAETCETERSGIIRHLMRGAEEPFQKTLAAIPNLLNQALIYKSNDIADLEGIYYGIALFMSIESTREAIGQKLTDFPENVPDLDRRLYTQGRIGDLKTRVVDVHHNNMKKWKDTYLLLLRKGGLRAPKPPIFGEQVKNNRDPNGLLQLDKKRKDHKKPVLFSVAKDSDIRIVAEYATLKKNKGLVVNLSAIAKEAHLLKLSEESFINWVIKAINNRLKTHFIVVRELDALEYVDEPGKKGKKESVKKNLLAIMDKIEGFAVFAATPSQGYLTGDKSLKKFVVDPLTFDLWQVDAVVKEAMDHKKTPNDRVPVMSMARVIRGSRNDFSFGMLHDGTERFFKDAKKHTTLSARRRVAENIGKEMAKGQPMDVVNAILARHIDAIELGIETNGQLYFAEAARVVDNPNHGISTMLTGGGFGVTKEHLDKAEERLENLVALGLLDANNMGERLEQVIEVVLQRAQVHADDLNIATNGHIAGIVNQLRAEQDQHRDNLVQMLNEKTNRLRDKQKQVAGAFEIIMDDLDEKQKNARNALALLREDHQGLVEDVDQRFRAAHDHAEDNFRDLGNLLIACDARLTQHILETAQNFDQLGNAVVALQEDKIAIAGHLVAMMQQLLSVRQALITYNRELAAVAKVDLLPMRPILNRVTQALYEGLDANQWPENIRLAWNYLQEVLEDE